MKNKIKSIFLITLLSVFSISSFSVDYACASIKVNWGTSGSKEIKEGMISWLDDDIPVKDLAKNSKNSENFLINFFKTFKWYIFSLIMIISVSMLVWIGIRMASANWNPDEFKKAWKHLLYLIIWLFVVFISWGLVSLVSGISIF